MRSCDSRIHFPTSPTPYNSSSANSSLTDNGTVGTHLIGSGGFFLCKLFRIAQAKISCAKCQVPTPGDNLWSLSLPIPTAHRSLGQATFGALPFQGNQTARAASHGCSALTAQVRRTNHLSQPKVFAAVGNRRGTGIWPQSQEKPRPPSRARACRAPSWPKLTLRSDINRSFTIRHFMSCAMSWTVSRGSRLTITAKATKAQ